MRVKEGGEGAEDVDPEMKLSSKVYIHLTSSASSSRCWQTVTENTEILAPALEWHFS